MTQNAKLFGGDNVRKEFERLEAGLDPQQNRKTNGPEFEICEAGLPPKIETEKYQKRRLDMCDRIFESIVTDLKILVDNFNHEQMDQNEFLFLLRKTTNDLILFAPNGEVRKLIARATNVIIDGVTKDMNFSVDDDEEITCHC